MRWATAFIAVVTLSSSPAWACTPPPEWPESVRLDPAEVARVHVSNATYVDVVVVATVDQDYDFALEELERRLGAVRPSLRPDILKTFHEDRNEFAGGAHRFHFRVIDHLKGPDKTPFNISAYDAADPNYGGRVEPPFPASLAAALRPLDFADWTWDNHCDTPLFILRDGTYLVFRDARGHLLRTDVPIEYGGDRLEVGGPSFVRVSHEDPWLREVRRAVRDDAQRGRSRPWLIGGAAIALAVLVYLGIRVRSRRT